MVVEMSKASWLVAGLVPGLDCQPLKMCRAKQLLSANKRWSPGKAAHRLDADRRIGVSGPSWLATNAPPRANSRTATKLLATADLAFGA